MNRERIRAYQFVFRDVNKRIAHIIRAHGEAASHFLCECGEEDCVSQIKLELHKFDEIRRNEALFIAAPGHLAEGIDRLVEVRSGFDLLIQAAEA